MLKNETFQLLKFCQIKLQICFFGVFWFKTLYITNQKFKIVENFIWLRVTPFARAIKDFRKNTWHIFRFLINPSQIERFNQNQDLHKMSIMYNNIYIVFHQCEKCKDTFACKYSSRDKEGPRRRLTLRANFFHDFLPKWD